jgi:hypothetical protein
MRLVSTREPYQMKNWFQSFLFKEINNSLVFKFIKSQGNLLLLLPQLVPLLQGAASAAELPARGEGAVQGPRGHGGYGGAGCGPTSVRLCTLNQVDP